MKKYPNLYSLGSDGLVGHRAGDRDWQDRDADSAAGVLARLPEDLAEEL